MTDTKMPQDVIDDVVLELKCLSEVAAAEEMSVEGNPLAPIIDGAWQCIEALRDQRQAVPDGYFYTSLSGLDNWFFGELHEDTKRKAELGDITNLKPFWLSPPTPPSSNAEVVEPHYAHKWDRDGERCVKCGDKDWMNSKCSIPDTPPAADAKPDGEAVDTDELYQKRSAAMDAMNQIEKEYFDDYEYDDVESATHSPNDFEQILIADAFYGLVGNEDWARHFLEWQMAIPGSIVFTHPSNDAMRKALELLKAAKCPNCNGSGRRKITRTVYNNSLGISVPCSVTDLVDCEWCAKRQALANGEGK